MEMIANNIIFFNEAYTSNKLPSNSRELKQEDFRNKQRSIPLYFWVILEAHIHKRKASTKIDLDCIVVFKKTSPSIDWWPWIWGLHPTRPETSADDVIYHCFHRTTNNQIWVNSQIVPSLHAFFLFVISSRKTRNLHYRNDLTKEI